MHTSTSPKKGAVAAGALDNSEADIRDARTVSTSRHASLADDRLLPLPLHTTELSQVCSMERSSKHTRSTHSRLGTHTRTHSPYAEEKAKFALRCSGEGCD